MEKFYHSVHTSWKLYNEQLLNVSPRGFSAFPPRPYLFRSEKMKWSYASTCVSSNGSEPLCVLFKVKLVNKKWRWIKLSSTRRKISHIPTQIEKTAHHRGWPGRVCRRNQNPESG